MVIIPPQGQDEFSKIESEAGEAVGLAGMIMGLFTMFSASRNAKKAAAAAHQRQVEIASTTGAVNSGNGGAGAPPQSPTQ